MTIAEFIREQSEAILTEFEGFAAEALHHDDELSRTELRDGASAIIHAIADDIEWVQTRDEQIRKSRGQLDDPRSAIQDAARRHAADRAAQHFSLSEMAAEYRALRASVMRRWVDSRASEGRSAEIDEVVRFNEAIDASLSAALDGYHRRLERAEAARTAALSELELNEDRLTAILDTLPAAVVIVDASGRLIRDNAANRELWGVPPDTENWDQYGEWEAWWPDTGERIKAEEWAMTRALRHGTVTHGELIRNRPFDSDERRYYLNNVAPLSDAAGNIIGGVAAMLDVTDRIEAEEAVRESDRAKDEFLAILSHELRNPLAPLRSGLDLLAQPAIGREQVDAVLPMMTRQLSHLVRLVNDLLDVSRINRGTLELKLSSVRLDGAVHAAAEQVKDLIESQQHELKVETSPGDLMVEGDFERLVQVFANLLTNAARYTPAGGRIDARLAEEQGYAVLRVRDTGYGIPAERMEQLFKLFSQIPEHQERSAGGLGVGLALSRRLVERHGGSIDASSEGPGCGSEFTVRLPLRAGASTAHGSRPAEDQASGGALRVLVVDDNADAADALAMLLTVRGHATLAVHDGEAALRELERFRPEVILLDLGMPDMDGFEVARRVRQSPRGGDTYLVAVTGWGQARDRTLASEAGFDEHVTKPLDANKISSVLPGTIPKRTASPAR